MISLNTDCRGGATVIATFIFSSVFHFLPSTVFAQQVDPPVTKSPLTANEPLAPPDPDGEVPQDSPDLDVLMRGPLHEAFAAAQLANPEPSPLVAKEPPQSIEEVPPEYKPEGNNVQWIPGYWSWDEAQSDFVWISGLWRDVPPGRRWVPGYWEQAEGGYRWISGFWAEEEAEKLGYLPEPPASIDQGPSTAAPGEDYFYVPGNWDYFNGSYRWLSGHWQPIVQSWIWIPAHYIWTPRGCLYVPGYWDYEIASRGTCFAPVYFHRPIYTAVHYHYTPSCVVNINFNFFTHLFVRKGCGHYYYGNWYGHHFASYGYKPWVKYHSHRRYYDPHLNYYRCKRSLYDSRYNVVQWTARQHDFYAKHEYYRPRSTYSAHVKSVAKSKHKQHHDYLRKAAYVSKYNDVLAKSRPPTLQRDKIARTDVERLQQVADLRRQKFKKIEQQERVRNQKSAEYLAELQKHRRRTEVKSANLERRAAKNNVEHTTKSLKLPISEKRQVSSVSKRNQASFDTASSANLKKQVVQNQRNLELQRAIDKARRDAAKRSSQLQQQQKQRSQNVLQDQKRRQITAEMQRRKQSEIQRLANANRVRDNSARPTVSQDRLKQQQRISEQRRKFQEQVNQANIRRSQQQQEIVQQRLQQQRTDQARRQQELHRQNQLRTKQAQQQERTRRTQQHANRARDQQKELARRAQEQSRQELAKRSALQRQQQQQQVKRQQQQQRQLEQQRLQQQRQQQIAKQAQQQREQMRRSQEAAKRAQQLDRARRAQEQARRNAAQKAAAQRQQQIQRKQQQAKRNFKTR